MFPYLTSLLCSLGFDTFVVTVTKKQKNKKVILEPEIFNTCGTDEARWRFSYDRYPVDVLVDRFSETIQQS